MLERMRVKLAGEPMDLMSDRALYWPARRRLMIADLHLGKGNVFRGAGIAIPTGGTAYDLRRLSALLAFTDATALWILGDVLHAAHHADVDAQWLAFRRAHAHVDIAALPGNHDRHIDFERLDMSSVADGTRDGHFIFKHAPSQHTEPDGHAISGHVHPVVYLPTVGRVPVFWIRPRQTVLPAFSAFTGGYLLPTSALSQCVACNGDSLMPLARSQNGPCAI